MRVAQSLNIHSQPEGENSWNCVHAGDWPSLTVQCGDNPTHLHPREACHCPGQPQANWKTSKDSSREGTHTVGVTHADFPASAFSHMTHPFCHLFRGPGPSCSLSAPTKLPSSKDLSTVHPLKQTESNVPSLPGRILCKFSVST